MARFRFKQRPLNDKQKIGSPYQLTDGERLLSIVVTVVNFSADKYLIQLFQYCLAFLKYNKALEILSEVVLHHLKK